MNPKVSIIVPVYNSEKYLKKCIQSIVSQEYDNYEIIVVNDGSTDNSLKILKSFSERIIRSDSSVFLPKTFRINFFADAF